MTWINLEYEGPHCTAFIETKGKFDQLLINNFIFEKMIRPLGSSKYQDLEEETLYYVGLFSPSPL